MVRGKVFLLLFLFFLSSVTFSQEEYIGFKGNYLGQKPPGLTKQVFAPGFISSDAPEGCICFSYDGRYLVFRRGWREETEVYLLEKINGQWTKPKRAPFFIKEFRFGDFTFSPNELKLYFTSDRPTETGAKKNESSDLWVVENINKEWLTPTHLGTSVNSPLHESYPSVSSDKSLYFFRRFDSDNGVSEILYAEYKNGKYLKPVIMGKNINTEWDEWDPCISPDGNILLFCSKKPTGMGVDDLYVSFKDKKGQWSDAINLGDKVNSARSENRPFITADEKYLFFSSDADGNRDIYWISMDHVRNLKK
jgi:Tol biopolymer transport system component